MMMTMSKLPTSKMFLIPSSFEPLPSNARARAAHAFHALVDASLVLRALVDGALLLQRAAL